MLKNSVLLNFKHLSASFPVFYIFACNLHEFVDVFLFVCMLKKFCLWMRIPAAQSVFPPPQNRMWWLVYPWSYSSMGIPKLQNRGPSGHSAQVTTMHEFIGVCFSLNLDLYSCCQYGAFIGQQRSVTSGIGEFLLSILIKELHSLVKGKFLKSKFVKTWCIFYTKSKWQANCKLPLCIVF